VVEASVYGVENGEVVEALVYGVESRLDGDLASYFSSRCSTLFSPSSFYS
jgi:hypothetical protein